MYGKLSGDTTYTTNAIRTLNWATYTVANDGRNRYIRDDIWLTDGYGDYVRHYLRAMAAMPELAPKSSDHVLKSSSIICEITYEPSKITYRTYDDASEEIFRLVSKPERVRVNDSTLAETDDNAAEGWKWQPLDEGGILNIKHAVGNKIEVMKK
jgi:hypothetical protein